MPNQKYIKVKKRISSGNTSSIIGFILVYIVLLILLLKYCTYFVELTSEPERYGLDGSFINYLPRDSNSIIFHSFFLFCLLLIFISMTLNVIRVVKTKYGRVKTKDAFLFLDEVAKTKRQYCLILRPFGNDSNILLNQLFIVRRFSLPFFLHRRDLTIESVIQNEVKLSLGIDSFALVDPQIILLPTSPNFLHVQSKKWEFAIDQLLKSALLTVFIIPKEKEIRKSLIKELFRAAYNGLYGRIIIILPPHLNTSQEYILEEISNNLKFLFAAFDSIPKDTIAIYFDDITEVIFLRAKATTKRKVNSISSYVYKNGIRNLIEKVKSNVSHLSYAERYPFQGQDYEAFPEEMDTYQMEILLKLRRGE